MKRIFMFSVGAMAGGLLSWANPGISVENDPDKALHDWQVRRLMEPSPHEREKERKGSVYIYDGLTEREVDAALETQFPRIQYMMFMGTVKTDEHGKPIKDPDSGTYLQESGSCGD